MAVIIEDKNLITLLSHQSDNVTAHSPKLKEIQILGVGGGYQVVWRAYAGVIHCIFDQIPNLQNCFTTSNKNLGGEGASHKKHLLPSIFTGQFFIKSRHLGFDVFIDICSMYLGLGIKS
jgi:hypothetical protein